MSNYGILEITKRDGVSPSAVRATVPKVEKGKYYSKQFSYKRYGKLARSMAVLWRDKTGREEHGVARWDEILKCGCVRKFNSQKRGVCVYLQTTSCGRWKQWIVSWREYDEKWCKVFSKKKFGCLDLAEWEAHKFATIVRSRLMKEKTPKLDFEFEV